MPCGTLGRGGGGGPSIVVEEIDGCGNVRIALGRGAGGALMLSRPLDSFVG